jgi:TRAP-type mannitol/chloroaromatic compound transport system permease small subunit
MSKALKIVDAISDWGGKIARWFVAALILVIVYEVFNRYVLNSPSIWGYEVSIALGTSLYAFGYAYTESKRAHVRVDVFYIHMSPRTKAIFDTFGGLIFFLPVIAFVVFAAWTKMFWSWSVLEKSVEGFWYPPWYPLRTMIFIGWTLLLIQGSATLTRNVYHAVTGRAYGV